MSSQLKSPNGHQKDKLEVSRAVIGAQLPRIRLLAPRQFAWMKAGRRGRLRDRVMLARAYRPIQGYLVTHRRRFTTGHKHKQPYQD